MKNARKIIIIMMVLMLGTCLLLGGCTTAKKPYTPTPKTSNKTNITAPTPTTPTPTPVTTNGVAKRSITEAKSVNGVNNATAVINGKMMYIGLDLNANLGKNETTAIEKTVLSRVKKMEPGYTIRVTSDADTVTRIKKVSQGVAKGTPINSFSQELKNIENRINPIAK